jgi:hypothetical protein
MSATLQEIPAELREMLLGGQGPCDHGGVLPLYHVGDQWCCDRCYPQAKMEADADAQTWRIREAFPFTFAPELIERARGSALTPSELDHVRANTSRWLRRYGLGGLLG